MACATRPSVPLCSNDAAASGRRRAAATALKLPPVKVQDRRGGAYPSAASPPSAKGMAEILTPVAAHAAAGSGCGHWQPFSVGAPVAGSSHAKVAPRRLAPKTTAADPECHPAPPVPSPNVSNMVCGAPSETMFFTATAASPARPPPPRRHPSQGSFSAFARLSRPLVIAPPVHLHGGLRENVTAALSAKFV